MSIATVEEFTTLLARSMMGWRAMKHLRFEPFGEAASLDEDDGDGRGGRASLLWIGTVIFWSLAVMIVIARMYYFQPFDQFDRVTKLEVHRHDAKIERGNERL